MRSFYQFNAGLLHAVPAVVGGTPRIVLATSIGTPRIVLATFIGYSEDIDEVDVCRGLRVI